MDIEGSYSDYSERESEDPNNTSISFSKHPVQEYSMRDTARSFTRSKILYSIQENPDLENKDVQNSPNHRPHPSIRRLISQQILQTHVTNEDSTNDHLSMNECHTKFEESIKYSARRALTDKRMEEKIEIDNAHEDSRPSYKSEKSLGFTSSRLLSTRFGSQKDDAATSKQTYVPLSSQTY